MVFRLDDALPVLRRTPAALRALLLNLPDPWIEATEGAGTWSPFDVVGHLIHGERTDWVPRVEHLLRHGETVPFPAFDREAMFVASQGLSLGELLDTFERLRAESLDRLLALGLSDADLARCGKHPEFGVVTLGQHLATWTAHDLTHVSQIVRVMARQYTMAVGPWRPYLSILGPASPARIRGTSARTTGETSRAARSTRVARPAPVQSTESPAKQLSGFIAKYDPAVAKLVRAARAALRKAETPMAATGRGHTVIKSVSAKQRPRRPTPKASIKLKKNPEPWITSRPLRNRCHRTCN